METKDKIQKLIDANDICLFMKVIFIDYLFGISKYN